MMESSLEVRPVNPNMLAFKAAITYSVYFLVLIYLFKWIGIDNNDPNMPIAEKVISFIASYVPFILAILYVQTTFKKDLGGYITLGKAFSAGFKVAAYTGLFLAILLIFYYKVLDQSAYVAIMDTAVKTAGDDPNKVKGVEMMRPYMIFFIGFGAAISYTFFGLIIALIGAAVLKKEKPLFLDSEV